MGRLRTTVHVTDDAGVTHVFRPHSSVPDWATEKITNPKAWETEPEPRSAPVIEEQTPPPPPENPDPTAPVVEPNEEPNTTGDGDQPPQEVETEAVAEPLPEPPRSGKGSSVDAWREYAMSTGWFDEIPDGVSRDDIITAVDEQRAAIDAEKE